MDYGIFSPVRLLNMCDDNKSEPVLLVAKLSSSFSVIKPNRQKQNATNKMTSRVYFCICCDLKYSVFSKNFCLFFFASVSESLTCEKKRNE